MGETVRSDSESTAFMLVSIPYLRMLCLTVFLPLLDFIQASGCCSTMTKSLNRRKKMFWLSAAAVVVSRCNLFLEQPMNWQLQVDAERLFSILEI